MVDLNKLSSTLSNHVFNLEMRTLLKVFTYFRQFSSFSIHLTLTSIAPLSESILLGNGQGKWPKGVDKKKIHIFASSSNILYGRLTF